MKKIISLALVAVMLVSVLMLSACGSTYGKIEKNFVDDGFEVVDTSDENGSNILSVTTALEDGEISCTVHVLKKGAFTYAIIAEYSGDKEAAEALDDYLDGGLASTLKDLDESKIVNGNCLLIPVALNIVSAKSDVNNMIELFNK